MVYLACERRMGIKTDTERLSSAALFCCEKMALLGGGEERGLALLDLLRPRGKGLCVVILIISLLLFLLMLKVLLLRLLLLLCPPAYTPLCLLDGALLTTVVARISPARSFSSSTNF